jgi:TPR repeat protein
VDACADLAEQIAERSGTCAAKLRELACKADHPRSCADLAEQLLAQPRGADTRVRTLLEKACDGGFAKSCTRLGELELTRLGRYDAGVKKLLSRGCDLGDGKACFLAAKRSRVFSVDAQSGKLLERGCDLGHEASCFNLGVGLLRRYISDPTQRQRGEQLLSSVCDGSSKSAAEACFVLGQHYGATQTKYFERACKLGHFNSCIEILVGHHTAGRRKEAIALATKMLEKQPHQWRPRWIRGASLFNTGQHDKAVPDLEKLLELRPDWPLMAAWIYAAKERSGSDGKQIVKTTLAKVGDGNWPAPVFKYLLGKISMGKLLKATKNKNAQQQRMKECEAYYYIGQQMLIRGKERQAKVMFQKSIDTQVTDYVEYTGSKAELALLAKP